MRMRRTIGLSIALLIISAPVVWAKETHSAQHHPTPSVKAKPGRAATASTRSAARHYAAAHRTARAERRRGERERERTQEARLPPPDEYLGPVRDAGQREIGSAAWYGGRHVGGRTATGERLDDIHLTAAHRSLPLHSLVRVTNLRNGRSVIVKINDRGPVSRSLLIDVSPRVAEELDMKSAGIATVAVVPVVPVAAGSSTH